MAATISATRSNGMYGSQMWKSASTATRKRSAGSQRGRVGA